ncbi:UNKNOWN [Stylonychia lemnae]|uniref:Uncharacterized protein n=1 Tax=Stylonychia lemnae TaxID=5949 RepID=A0A078BBR0_STYLE|nr:UNKNOWN [Stylonychia lemnae]|eukprot:CDW90697.1 UNKNOWN [Stylonychia lemnae]
MENLKLISSLKRALKVVTENFLGINEVRQKDYIKSETQKTKKFEKSPSLAEIYESDDNYPGIHLRLNVPVKIEAGKEVIKDIDFIMRVHQDSIDSQTFTDLKMLLPKNFKLQIQVFEKSIMTNKNWMSQLAEPQTQELSQMRQFYLKLVDYVKELYEFENQKLEEKENKQPNQKNDEDDF